MPSEQELPPGPLRKFVVELHHHFREAGRPPAEKIAMASRRLESKDVSLSRETVRRLLRGASPSDWARVELCMRTLCMMANQDPDRRRWPPSEDRFEPDDDETCVRYLQSLWHNAVDDIEPGPDAAPAPPPKAAPAVPSPTNTKKPGAWPTTAQSTNSAPADDPWATTTTNKDDPWATTPQKQNTYSDEPPF
ncbi:hypothetical protein OKJ48_04760 [Streptomyces kunmingensis]|uniref:Uncharacterized protein n=1 Tax=Streptomyces kunmingensis TaxID=68225 RepID=A0ABU6C4A8_9ACTN|nr:hypothetical protein [Streptomyces kunmingensis]MEB3959564.1 hypothetical protein [Streptomyces kunmingensis]